jgi:hypothetical protein
VGVASAAALPDVDAADRWFNQSLRSDDRNVESHTVADRPSELRALLAVRAEYKAERASMLPNAQLQYKGNMTRDIVGAV